MSGDAKPATTRVRAVLEPNGQALVQLQVGDVLLNLSPDAAATMSLNLLTACYQARAERAAWMYAKQANLNPSELIKLMRNGQ